MSLQIWIDGLFAGSVFAIIALSMTIVYQPTRIMNFAQGEGFILGAALGYQFIGVWHWPLAKAIIGLIIASVLMGLIMERMIMLPVQLSGSKFAWIIATLAAALIFQSAFNLKWVNVTFSYFDFVDKDISIAGSKLSIQKLIVILFMILIYAANELFLKKTLWGRSIRAIAHNGDTSTILGIPTKPVIKMGFITGTVVIAAVGFLAAPVIIVAPAAGLFYTIQGFTAGIIGGVGSAKGAVVGGLTIGILDSVVRSWLGGTWGLFSTFFVLALILILKPNGFFGKRVEGR
jgi:branched-chain amino acid transport system permease protein